MNEPWNCWPGGWCPSTAANIGIGLGIAALLTLMVGLVIWAVATFCDW